ncbi:MAG: hypothetical protein EAZ25_06295 [Oscillatoriales cyanobacterium]|nr:MAG: hypothetical protein EAZ25_06295 [Oscillatoriales cyanobacterium]
MRIFEIFDMQVRDSSQDPHPTITVALIVKFPAGKRHCRVRISGQLSIRFKTAIISTKRSIAQSKLDRQTAPTFP